MVAHALFSVFQTFLVDKHQFPLVFCVFFFGPDNPFASEAPFLLSVHANRFCLRVSRLVEGDRCLCGIIFRDVLSCFSLAERRFRS